MANGHVTVCDKCKFEFELTPDLIKVEQLSAKDGVEMTYFSCPECRAEYVILVTNDFLRKEIERIKRLREAHTLRVRKGGAPEKLLARKQKEIYDLSARISNLQKDLRGHWLGDK